MDYNVENNAIKLTIPASNKGKFRFKKRNKAIEFGNTFSTRKESFDTTAYLEWQISYDIQIAKVNSGDIQTALNKYSFIGRNGKEKYPYELPELLFKAVECGLSSRDEINSLFMEIEKYDEFVDRMKIDVIKNERIDINGLTFEETSIRLPTLFMCETQDETQIEVSIQKQQYASGVQPMIYFCIPFTSFSNYSDLLGKSSERGDVLFYIISRKNIKVIYDLFRVFAMASERHHYDIKKILEVMIDKYVTE